jgi:hypothetical protein
LKGSVQGMATMNLDRTPTQAAPGEAAAVPRLSKDMEDEVYGLLGALLGMLEVLSIDTVDPLVPRQHKLVADALHYGDMLRARVEGLITLFSDAHDARFKPVEYSLRRLLDHAVRGATWSAADKGVSIVLPDSGDWEQVMVGIDPARTDRALRAITDTLVGALAAQDRVLVRVQLSDDFVQVELSGVSDAAIKPALRELSAVLCAAWLRLFSMHGGGLSVQSETMTVQVRLPRREPH